MTLDLMKQVMFNSFHYREPAGSDHASHLLEFWVTNYVARVLWILQFPSFDFPPYQFRYIISSQWFVGAQQFTQRRREVE